VLETATLEGIPEFMDVLALDVDVKGNSYRHRSSRERTGCAVTGILEGDAVANGNAQSQCTLEIRLGVGLRLTDIVTSDDCEEKRLP
jgi:hypothetical protein